MSDSPFNADGLQIAWDSTSLGWLKDCPRKYYYSMIEGWRSRGAAIDLDFGIHVHSALESYYKLRAIGEEHDEAVVTVVHDLLLNTWENGEPWKPDHKQKNRFTLLRTIVWYLEEFRDDPAQTHILQDGRPAVELSFRVDMGDGLLLCGHLDRVVDFQGHLFVMDHKTTTKKPSSYYFDYFSPDNQMSLYTIGGLIGFQMPVKGVIIDAMQTLIESSTFERGLTYRTEAQLEEWLDNTRWWIAQVPSMKENGWPMNDRACRLCSFRDICSKDPRVRDKFLETGFVRKHWNPLEVR